jgi:hypothetical protein
MAKKGFFAGMLAIALVFGLVLTGCDVLGKVATGCVNQGTCIYSPTASETKTCTQSSCAVYKAANSMSNSPAVCNCAN